MSRNWRGDTIVEVLLAIGIATFGIGVTYATAQRGLRQTITARERNQALNLVENQINDLRVRYQIDPANFEITFGSASPNNHYCLVPDTTPSPSQPWLPYKNPSASPTALNSSNYNSHCTPFNAGDGVTYYIDIQATNLPAALPTGPHTLYQIFVRWLPDKGSQINQASENFKVNGAGTAQLLP